MSANVGPELVDRLIDLYCDWRTACSEVRTAYGQLTAAAAEERARAYAVFGAALDREESAAGEYARHLVRVADLAPSFAAGAAA